MKNGPGRRSQRHMAGAGPPDTAKYPGDQVQATQRHRPPPTIAPLRSANDTCPECNAMWRPGHVCKPNPKVATS